MDIAWRNKQENLRWVCQQLQQLSGTTEIVVLPEMFSTGFSMHPASLAEVNEGETITALQEWAREFNLAIAGSFIAKEETAAEDNAAEDNAVYYNRAFFISPESEVCFRDKHHLFRMGGEHRVYQPGKSREIIHYRGWRILLQVCYDLRFPVWSRCRDNEYDLLIYVANWPEARQTAWDTLLRARAIENLCYVAGCNRVGEDGGGMHHAGGSAIVDFKGEYLASFTKNEEGMATATLFLDAVNSFRERFPAFQDADSFTLL